MASLGLFVKRSTSCASNVTPLLSFRRNYVGPSATAYQYGDPDVASQRNLLFNVLNANVTKRDAKQFLARCAPSPSPLSKTADDLTWQRHVDINKPDRDRLLTGVETRLHSWRPLPKQVVAAQCHTHLGLICLRSLDEVDDACVEGLAATFSHLSDLGMQLIIVVDLSLSGILLKDGTPDANKVIRCSTAKEAKRLGQAIARHCPKGSQSVAIPFEWATPDLASEQVSNHVAITTPDQFLDPLERGQMVIVPSIAQTVSGQLLPVPSRNVMTLLAQELRSGTLNGAPVSVVDRVIVVDPVGAVPNTSRKQSPHIVINLEHQYQSIKRELSEYAVVAERSRLSRNKATVYQQHVENLAVIRDCLALLPSTSSGVILSPAAAACPSPDPATKNTNTKKDGRRKNILIHNLLTNKPLISSSLPAARLQSPTSDTSSDPSTAASSATLVKRGLPVTVVPAEQAQGWQQPTNGKTTLKLEEDPRIDFPRLVHLINDSFGRKLDIPHYLSRIRNRIAGVVVVGEYEGAAIFTWEMPPDTQDTTRLVPYLDKFAVLPSSQGAKGVADLLFQEMVENCFPDRVCWRSRKNNPVNKWYFERAAGSWRIPGSEWTMFWAGEVVAPEDRWRDYLGVCRSVPPSWIDDGTSS